MPWCKISQLRLAASFRTFQVRTQSGVQRRCCGGFRGMNTRAEVFLQRPACRQAILLLIEPAACSGGYSPSMQRAGGPGEHLDAVLFQSATAFSPFNWFWRGSCCCREEMERSDLLLPQAVSSDRCSVPAGARPGSVRSADSGLKTIRLWRNQATIRCSSLLCRFVEADLSPCMQAPALAKVRRPGAAACLNCGAFAAICVICAGSCQMLQLLYSFWLCMDTS